MSEQDAREERIAHFRLLGPLGTGGMGVVYRALDEKLGREVALKVISESQGLDATFRGRFLREGKAAAAVQHPAVATVFEIGEDRERLYIAMELIRGRTLRTLVGSLAPRRALELGAELAEGLAAAHAAGVVHRDIKPENVLVSQDDRVKILDFGLARWCEPSAPDPAGATSELLTRAGAMMGTPGYMSPEQALSEEIGPPSDVFSLGVVLYEMLGHRRPFAGSSMMACAVAVTRDEPSPLSEHAALPSDVVGLVHRCLDKRAEARPTAAELARRLRALAATTADLESQPTAVEPASLAPPHAPAPRPSSNPAQGSAPAATAPRRPRNKLWPGLAGVAVLALGVALASTRSLSFSVGPQPSAAPTTSAAPPAPPSTSPDTPTPITSLPIARSPTESARAAYDRALASLRRADWGRAREQLDEAVRSDPTFLEAQLRLAHLEGVFGERKQARERLRAVADREAELSERDRAWFRAVEALHVNEPADYHLAGQRFAEASRRWPGDAELRFMIAATQERVSKLDGALEQARAAVALDPQYADALQIVARLVLRKGKVDEAMQTFDQCVDARSVDCIQDRLRMRARLGQCAEVVSDAKLMESRGSRGVVQWVYAASALVAQGEPFAAAEAFLRNAEEQASTPRAQLAARLARVRAALLQGRFSEAQEKLGLLLSGATSLEDRAALTALATSLSVELRDDRGLIRTAEQFLTERHAAEGGFGQVALEDPVPPLWWDLSRAGRLSEDDLEHKLAGWEAGKRKLGFDDGTIWFQARVAGVVRAEDAKRSLATRPPGFDMWQLHDDNALHFGVLGWDALGRTYLLAGDAPKALELLLAVQKSCTLLVHPMAHVRSAFTLGETYEALGDPQKACGAYGEVMRRWGEAVPRALTADLASKRMTALKCSARR